MKAIVKYCASPSGTITPVSSKSISNRVLIIDALTGSSCHIENLSEAEDTQVLRHMLQKYHGAYEPVTLDAGMAGTAMRFMTTYCCRGHRQVLLTGSARMLQRPMKDLVEALRRIGAHIEYTDREGYAPLLIKPAKIKGGALSIDAGISSQFISSLMLCAPFFEDGLELDLIGQPVSHSYIEMTAQLMQKFGAVVRLHGNRISVSPGRYYPRSYTVEGDWSSAAYFYSLAALSENCEIELRQMNIHSMQGDKTVMAMTTALGLETVPLENGLLIRKKKMVLPTRAKENFLLCPDLAQTMAVVYAGLKMEKAELVGLRTLRGKETDRIKALENELKRFGVHFYCVEDDFFSFDARSFHAPAGTIRTYDDHRMAMAFAPLAQKTGTLVIEDAQVVQKSYPAYWNDLKSLGCLVENSDI